jgi:hypothetical protein
MDVTANDCHLFSGGQIVSNDTLTFELPTSVNNLHGWVFMIKIV